MNRLRVEAAKLAVGAAPSQPAIGEDADKERENGLPSPPLSFNCSFHFLSVSFTSHQSATLFRILYMRILYLIK